MRKKVALIALITALLITGVTFTVLSQKPTQTAPETPTAQVTKPLNADTIFELVNQEREKAGLQPLVRDARLDASAQAKADDMANNNYFAHVNPVTGVDGYTLIPNGICSYKSENISEMVDDYGDNNLDTILGWMGSESHRNALLNADYDLAGMAVSGNKVVQHFCNLK